MSKQEKKLTPKQQRFVDEYMVDHCGAKAAIRAGYARPQARSAASELLTKPNVKAAIAAKQIALSKKLDITVDTVAAELEEARSLAMRGRQPAAAVSASMGKARLMGLIVEKHRHSGAIGSYDLSKVSDADLALLERILGGAAPSDAGGDPSGEEA